VEGEIGPYLSKESTEGAISIIVRGRFRILKVYSISTLGIEFLVFLLKGIDYSRKVFYSSNRGLRG
jgi:DNA-binding PadR family transcriptional regulator